MPQRDPRVLLRHMLDFAREACEMAAGHAREDLDTQRQPGGSANQWWH